MISRPLDRRYTSPALLSSRRGRRCSCRPGFELMVDRLYRKPPAQSKETRRDRDGGHSAYIHQRQFLAPARIDRPGKAGIPAQARIRANRGQGGFPGRGNQACIANQIGDA